METKNKQIYFPVSKLKFSLMSICTLSLYPLYWNYKNWCYIKDRDQANIMPLWRSIFYPLWYYSLLTHLCTDSKNDNVKNSIFKSVLVTVMLLFSICSILPDPYWLVSIFIFIPILPAVHIISKINASREVNKKITSHRLINFITYLIGGTLVAFITLSVIGFFPSTMVVSGNKIWEKDLEYLRSQNILADNEEILYFYSYGLLSIKEDGQFISEDHITSYFIDPEDNSIYTSKAAYEVIEKIDVTWSSSWLEDTTVIVTTTDGEAFEIWLSEESEGDKKFVNEMNRLWKIKKTSP